MARAPGNPSAADLDHAYLYRLTDDAADRVNLAWLITVKSGGGETTIVTAYSMPKDEFDRLSALANTGDAQAEYNLGRVYGSGVAGTPDREKSAEWISKAAQQGLPAAANALGQYFEFGVGVPKDVRAAVSWYTKSANAGYPPGQYNLGLMYEGGLGVKQDFVTARDWIAKAAKQDVPAAIDELPRVMVAANGQIKKYQEMKAQQAASRQCPAGYHWMTNGCESFGGILNTYRMATGHNM